MQKILSVDNMRRSDAYTCANHIPSRDLMFAAGKAFFAAVDWKPPVAVVCGSGNNAGDGYVLASFLWEAGIPCRLFLLKEKFSEDGQYYYSLCRKKGVPVELCSESTDFSSFCTVADCLLGTGFHGEVTGLLKDIIEAINRSGAYVVSADINSGLNGDSGLCNIAVRSNLTVSFGDYQPGHFLGMAKDLIGRRVNCPIGIEPLERPYQLWEAEDVLRILKPRSNFSNKGDYGYIALIGGCLRYSGAIRLANLANSAMRAGAGVVKLAVPRSICPGIMPHILESTLFPLSDEDGDLRFVPEEFAVLLRGVRTAAFGMGIGNGDETRKAVSWMLANFSGTLVIDADGLSALATLPVDVISARRCRLVLTPHLKEFSRLSGYSIAEINTAPINLAETYAASHKLVLLLKGPTTVVTDGQSTYLSTTGCPGMATAGSGDVLSGITAALCAATPDSLTEAVVSAAFINGLAGELAQSRSGAISMTAGDTAAAVRDAVLKITAS